MKVKNVPYRKAEDAALWFREAAGQGCAAAQFNLGVLHEDGQRLERSRVQLLRKEVQIQRIEQLGCTNLVVQSSLCQ